MHGASTFVHKQVKDSFRVIQESCFVCVNHFTNGAFSQMKHQFRINIICSQRFWNCSSTHPVDEEIERMYLFIEKKQALSCQIKKQYLQVMVFDGVDQEKSHSPMGALTSVADLH